jgi:N-glycosylase/DNA lyase
MPFELPVVARSHGWYSLPPFRWDPARGELGLAMRAGGTPVAIDLRQHGRRLRVEVTSELPLSGEELDHVRVGVRWCLRLDEDLEPFVSLRQPCVRSAG